MLEEKWRTNAEVLVEMVRAKKPATAPRQANVLHEREFKFIKDAEALIGLCLIQLAE